MSTPESGHGPAFLLLRALIRGLSVSDMTTLSHQRGNIDIRCHLRIPRKSKRASEKFTLPEAAEVRYRMA